MAGRDQICALDLAGKNCSHMVAEASAVCADDTYGGALIDHSFDDVCRKYALVKKWSNQTTNMCDRVTDVAQYTNVLRKTDEWPWNSVTHTQYHRKWCPSIKTKEVVSKMIVSVTAALDEKKLEAGSGRVLSTRTMQSFIPSCRSCIRSRVRKLSFERNVCDRRVSEVIRLLQVLERRFMAWWWMVGCL